MTDNYDFLKKIPLFHGLTDPDLEDLCGVTLEVELAAGEELFAEGSHGDRAYVVKEGQLEILKVSSGREVLVTVSQPGDVIGEMALLEQRPRMASVRARTDATLIVIQKDQFDQLLRTSRSAASTMFYTVLERWRETEAALRQSEKMAQLGTLSAGVAHELNNPAAAVKRGAKQLQTAVSQLETAQAAFAGISLTPDQREVMSSCFARAQERAAQPPEMDALARSDREAELEAWLEERGIGQAWSLAPVLVNLDYEPDELETMARCFPDHLSEMVDWAYATYTVYNLLAEIDQGAGRISEIVKALKEYAYLDQAPVQEVDVHEGLDNTLLIMQHKLKEGINVRREYAPDLPRIQAHGSELNQVWTNIIDNAVEALMGDMTSEARGARDKEITLRTRQEGDWVVVEIEDNGPGIPPEYQSRVFDPFFTTKPPGKGTGLGLEITYNIVVNKHRGDIRLFSEPGHTCFQVWLPTNHNGN